MTIPYPKAQRVCTATEFQLLTLSRPAELKKFKAAGLKTKIARTRGFLDKWRALGISQARKSKAGETPERTAQKREWFEEALRRFEGQLAKLEKAAAAPENKPSAPTRKPTGAKSAPGGKPVGGAKGNPMKSPSAVATRGKVKDIRIAKTGLQSRVRGHVSASGRRNQAKRNLR